MRLIAEQASPLRQVARKRFGEDTRVWLFGSRVNDHARGDIDLLIEVMQIPENAFRDAIELETTVKFLPPPRHHRKISRKFNDGE
jgi:predicted nucleotidyltransferase